jgi:hypothetical protein
MSINKIQCLPTPDSQQAMLLLQTIARNVQPIMKKRGWTVRLLLEFSQPGLLGLNEGSGNGHSCDCIKIRLRQNNNKKEFLHIEELIDTMLHELCHIVIAPHSKEFHALWNLLRKEWEDNQANEINGEIGAGIGGIKLDSLKNNVTSLCEAKKKAADAAEKRIRLNCGSPQKLGGAKLVVNPKEAAREAALKRAKLL